MEKPTDLLFRTIKLEVPVNENELEEFAVRFNSSR